MAIDASEDYLALVSSLQRGEVCEKSFLEAREFSCESIKMILEIPEKPCPVLKEHPPLAPGVIYLVERLKGRPVGKLQVKFGGRLKYSAHVVKDYGSVKTNKGLVLWRYKLAHEETRVELILARTKSPRSSAETAPVVVSPEIVAKRKLETNELPQIDEKKSKDVVPSLLGELPRPIEPTATVYMPSYVDHPFGGPSNPIQSKIPALWLGTPAMGSGVFDSPYVLSSPPQPPPNAQHSENTVLKFLGQLQKRFM